MKEPTLVVYYSNTGTSRTVAQLLAAQMDWPCGEIRESASRAGFWGNLRCVLDSLFARKPAISYVGPDPAGFETVVLIAPIWLGQMAGPMRSFLHAWRHTLGRVGVVSVMGGRGAATALAETESVLARTPVMSLALTAAEVQQGSHAASLRSFGIALRERDTQDAVRPVILSPSAG